MKKYYIGLSVSYHDPALAIIDAEGRVLFAEAAERHLQNKRALNCPPDSLTRMASLLQQYCPQAGHITIALNWRKKRPLYETLLAHSGFLSAPGLLKKGFKRLRSPLENYQLHHMIACQRAAIHSAAVNLVRIIQEQLPDCTIAFADFDHHRTHAAMACYSSPFTEAACAVIDSFGENGSMAFYHYRNGQLQCLHESRGPGSLGFYYMKITELCGFDWLKGEEWKVMGLAPYGQLDKELYGLLTDIIRVDGFVCKHSSRRLFQQLDQLQRFRRQQQAPDQQAANQAYTGQRVFAELMAKVLQHLHEVTACKQLTLAGGCALNSAFNGQITQRTGFQNVHIPSAPADDGTALGAAWLGLHQEHPELPKQAARLSPYLGSSMDMAALDNVLRFNRCLDIEYLPDTICQATAKLLAQGQRVAWVQGRAEFGPRALGNRSILADPRDAAMKDRINDNIKFRESFRPFAPSILAEYGADYFENYQPSPYMDKTLSIRPARRSAIPAVCHVDGSGRLQTVEKQANPRFHQLLSHFHQLTGTPVLLNTSFNVMGKPLVHSVQDALSVFISCGLDVLVIGDYLIRKPRDAH